MNPELLPVPPGTRLVVGPDGCLLLEHDATGERVPVSADGLTGCGPVPAWATWLPPGWPFEFWPLGTTPEHVRAFADLVDTWAGSKNMPPGRRSSAAACLAGRELARSLIGPTLPAGTPFSGIYPTTGGRRKAWRAVRDDLLAWRPPTQQGAAASPSLGPLPAAEVNPDGPAADGQTVRFEGRTVVLTSATQFRVAQFMWRRDAASFDDLAGHVYMNTGDSAAPLATTVKNWTSRTNAGLLPLRLRWRLSSDAVNRVVRKTVRESS